MADLMKIRALLKNGLTEVKVLMLHPMETGRRKNDDNEIVPAHFIQLVTATLNGENVLQAQWGTGVSKNPYLTFYLNDAKAGDAVGVKWQDNKGENNAIEGIVVAA
jgi:sulfur-oxidizing protein SoxZ